jgi:hypothetical protein
MLTRVFNIVQLYYIVFFNISAGNFSAFTSFVIPG